MHLFNQLWSALSKQIALILSIEVGYVFIGEFLILQLLAQLIPYLQIQRILINKLPNVTAQYNNTCRKLRVSAFEWY